jgi:antitoxin component HigA of HigAB toxin-antitoxin module
MALAEIEHYFAVEPEPGTPAGDRLDQLALLIEDYENKHWRIEPPDPIDAIRWRMETAGYSQADLGRLIGSRQRKRPSRCGPTRLCRPYVNAVMKARPSDIPGRSMK